MINKKIKFSVVGIFLIGILLFSLGLISAYQRTSPQLTQYQSTGFFSGQKSSLEFDEDMCSQGQDFVIQVAPFGCDPSVVRSDLLEEQNVPVYCKLAATKINPLIEVNAIDSLTFPGSELPSEVSGIGYLPAQAALGKNYQEIDSPILDDVGYAIITLKKQDNVSQMPDYVEGNLSAKIRYDVENAFGIGDVSYYLPVMDDEEWEENKASYSFWNGKGYLRAEQITGNDAVISLYDASGNVVHSSALSKGDVSSKINLPGFECYANLQLKLDDLKNVDTRAKLSINEGSVAKTEDETFLQGKCKIEDIQKEGLREKVEISCMEDDTKRLISSGKAYTLFINPVVELEIDNEKNTAAVGDYLYSDEKGNHYYLGYAGTKGDTGLKKDLKIVVMALPFENRMEKLTDKQINYVARLVRAYSIDSKEGKRGFLDLVKDTGEFTTGLASNFFNYVVKGSEVDPILYNEKKPLGGREIKLTGFGEPVNTPLEDYEDAEFNYNSAVSDYNLIIDDYRSEKVELPTGENYVYGEKAYYEKIRLAYELVQNADVLEFCDEFKEVYPKSDFYSDLVNEGKCEDSAKISSQDSSSVTVLVNGESRKISLDKIFEPSFEEYGARVLVRGPNGNTRILDLRKGEINYLSALKDSNEDDDEFIQLLEVKDDAIKFKLSAKQTRTAEGARESVKEFFIDTKQLKKDVPENFGTDYILTLKRTFVDKTADVSVLANIDDVGSETSFGFKIGIEKTGVELAPNRVKRIVKNMNESIEEWGEKQGKVGNLTQKLGKACVGVGVALTVKNFFANIGGKGIARKEVMSGSGGWNQRCANAVANGKLDGNTVSYSSVNDCILENSDKIDEQVSKYASAVEKENEKMKKLQDELRNGEDTVDPEKLEKRYLSSKYKNELKQNLHKKFPSGNMEINGEKVEIDKFVEDLGTEGVSIDDLRDLKVKSEAGYTDQIKQDVSSIYTSTKEINRMKDVSEKTDRLGLKGMTYISGEHKDKITKPYTGYKAENPSKNSDINKNEPLQGYSYKGKEYILGLIKPEGADFYRVKNVYDTDGNLINKENPVVTNFKENLDFKGYDEGSYKNKYNNAQIRYTETGTDKGKPSLVPFDTQNGWYANEISYDESGRLRSFNLCNVGKNNLQEFNSGSGVGDDTCQIINLATGQPYNQFPGLNDEEKIKRKVDDAVKAIEQAQKQHSSGIESASILGEVMKVGEPMAAAMGTQCTDFMSPKDCQLLFNVCDPVICPSSRCDFGGEFPVEDVKQTGIIGGLTLCLPNIREGIYLPVCLSGINAGMQSYIGLMEDYRDCMQDNLETGQLTGVCEEIYSVGVCEFFWRQAQPLLNAGIPKLMGALFGEGRVRGGGEYLTVQNSWDNAKKSLNYFTDYYSVASFEAFKARAVEEMTKSLFCRNSISAVYPDTGNMLDSLTEPASPPQFHGRIDVIPFTTSTNPPQSHYKVFYHIFAGQESRAYYQVYLKSSREGSYYQDIGGTRMVDQGYATQGETVSKTKDFTAPEGYNKLCINVNGQEECGFEKVSTSFAVNFISDKYKQEQIEKKDIASEKECISGSPSVYSLLTPSMQGAAEDLVDPQIYNKGITRICGTDNPGKGTDSLIGTEDQRWVEVGHCDNENMKCWLDTSTVDEVIKHTGVEEDTLQNLEQNSLKVLQNQGKYINENNFEQIYKEITASNKYPEERIELVEKYYEKVYLNKQRAKLLLVRAGAYGNIVRRLFNKNRRGSSSKNAEPVTNEESTPYRDPFVTFDNTFEELAKKETYVGNYLALVKEDDEELWTYDNTLKRYMKWSASEISGKVTVFSNPAAIPLDVASELGIEDEMKAIYEKYGLKMEEDTPILVSERWGDLEVNSLISGQEVRIQKDFSYSDLQLIPKEFEGELIIEGNVDGDLGERMVSGDIIVEGNVDGDIGKNMQGGRINIRNIQQSVSGTGFDLFLTMEGNIGEEMTGGEIIIEGDVTGMDGEEAGMVGEELDGGEIIIEGDVTGIVGPFMKSGKITVKGNVGFSAGARMQGGIIVIEGEVRGDDEYKEATGGELRIKGENSVYGKDPEDFVEFLDEDYCGKCGEGLALCTESKCSTLGDDLLEESDRRYTCVYEAGIIFRDCKIKKN